MIRSWLIGTGAALLAAGLATGLVPGVLALPAGTHHTRPPERPRYVAARNPFVLPAYAAAPRPTPVATPGGALGPNVGGAAGQVQVSSVFVGAQPFAVVQVGQLQSQVGIGDKIEGHTVLSITMDGVLLDNGTVLPANPLAGAYAAPAPQEAAPTAQTPPVVPRNTAPLIFSSPAGSAPPATTATPIPRPSLPYGMQGSQQTPSLPYGMTTPPTETH